MVYLLKKYKNILPFVIYISNEEKQKERFAVRSQYMTLDPKKSIHFIFNSKDKYIKYFDNIRIIQQYNVDHADFSLIPTIDNTSIDRSISYIQYSVFLSLKMISAKKDLFDEEKQTCAFKIRTVSEKMELKERNKKCLHGLQNQCYKISLKRDLLCKCCKWKNKKKKEENPWTVEILK
jgi:hypothetical protein